MRGHARVALGAAPTRRIAAYCGARREAARFQRDCSSALDVQAPREPPFRRSSGRSPAESLDLGRDAGDRSVEVDHHEVRVQPEDRVPGVEESAITACVCGPPGRMINLGAVDLNDEAQLWGEQVRDEPTEQRHLPTEGDAEPTRAERIEQARLGRGGSVPHLAGALGEPTVDKVTRTNGA